MAVEDQTGKSSCEEFGSYPISNGNQSWYFERALTFFPQQIQGLFVLFITVPRSQLNGKLQGSKGNYIIC